MQPRTPDLKCRPNALVEIKEEGKPYRFVADIKGTVDRVNAIAHVKAQLDQQKLNFPDYEPLLVTRFVTQKMADECRKFDLPFIDTAGNAYLRAPGMFVSVAGQDSPRALEKVGQSLISTTTFCNEMLEPPTMAQLVRPASSDSEGGQGHSRPMT